MPLKKNDRIRMTLAAILTWAALLVFAVGPGQANAGLSGCRTDPVLVLSNGDQIQMAAQIDTSSGNLKSVVYTVHAPVGSKVLLTLYTESPIGNVERVQFFADAAPNQYSTETVVTTKNDRPAVTATSVLVSALSTTLASGQDAGLAQQKLRIDLTR